jgi:hypothetical protein
MPARECYVPMIALLCCRELSNWQLTVNDLQFILSIGFLLDVARNAWLPPGDFSLFSQFKRSLHVTES